MKTVVIPEFGRIDRAALDPLLLRRLQRFDMRWAQIEGEHVFDWTDIRHVRARSYVGVVQVPGLVVEILPKVDGFDPEKQDRDGRALAQRNLLYMLWYTRDLPVRERDLADQSVEHASLLEAFISAFVHNLLEELRRGREHAYVHHEENLRCIRGRVLFAGQLRSNPVRRDRFFVGYEDFTADTGLNRIFKAACRALLNISRSGVNQQLLSEALLELADVEDRRILRHDLECIHFNRNTERFRRAFGTARLVLRGQSPSMRGGAAPAFSLLFPMEEVFEQFIARFICRHADALGLKRASLHAQAARHRRCLLRSDDERRWFKLKPDFLIAEPGQPPVLILDTKWKRLVADSVDPRNGVAQADIYQLYAYANRYGAADNVLLYPAVRGVQPKRYRLDGQPQTRIRIETIDLNRDLRARRQDFLADLRRVLDPAVDAD